MARGWTRSVRWASGPKGWLRRQRATTMPSPSGNTFSRQNAVGDIAPCTSFATTRRLSFMYAGRGKIGSTSGNRTFHKLRGKAKMSVELCVFLEEPALPTHAEWRHAIVRSGRNLSFDAFSLVEQVGFVPAKLDGQECGFEYFFSPIADGEFDELCEAIGARTHVASFAWHSSLIEGTAANIAAATLADIANGVFFDPQSGTHAVGKDAYSMMEDLVKSDREWKHAAAEQKWAKVTERRCPECNARCPEYRGNCWVCGHHVGRVASDSAERAAELPAGIEQLKGADVGGGRMRTLLTVALLVLAIGTAAAIYFMNR